MCSGEAHSVVVGNERLCCPFKGCAEVLTQVAALLHEGELGWGLAHVSFVDGDALLVRGVLLGERCPFILCPSYAAVKEGTLLLF